MEINWTQIILAVLAGAGGVGLWQYAIVKARLDSKERMALQEDKDAISTKWREIYDQLQKERDALNLQRVSDRQLWQERIAQLERQLEKTRVELALTTSAYKEIRSDLHTAEKRIKELEKRDAEKDDKIERLKRQVVELGGKPDTGPLHEE